MLIQPEGLVWAALALVLAAGISCILELGLSRSILWSGFRAFLQLFIVGTVLSYLFKAQSEFLAFATILLMTGIATQAVLGRLAGSQYPGIIFHVFFSLACGAWLFSFFAGSVVLEPGSWKRIEVILPFAGLLLGNSVSGITLGLTYWARSIHSERERIETRLAFGASAWESVFPILKQATSTAMTPIINSMTVAGVVSLPGMMTGQLLAGADPRLAVHYQIAVLFLISVSTLIGVLLALLLGYRTLFNSNHQFQFEFLMGSKSKDLPAGVLSKTK